jgi:two-component system chemotaxis response regulator CheB
MVAKKKILVIDDSAFMRRVISDIINGDSRCEVIGTAANGEDGLKLLEHLKPDVITLDIQMPIMDGLTMLKTMKQKYNIPVIMMSTLTKEGALETIQSLELGAFDFVAKPDNIFKVNSQEIRTELIEKIMTATQSRVRYENSQISTPISKPEKAQVLTDRPRVSHVGDKVTKLVAIGTSTGGPRALQYVLPYLPKDIEAGIVIVQHMPPGFTKSLAERLNNLSEIQVKEAEDGEQILNGTAYIAPGDRHLMVKQKGNQYVIHLSDGPKNGAHKPSVNEMMTSLAEISIPHIIGVVMTGMGADGREGIANLKQKREIHIIVQEEASCVVYGMPKAIVEAKLADEIIPLDQLAKVITKKVEVL